jgi:valyl-tRNA synthetase
MEGIRPWCISRQLWWGHQLPVWYCDACEETFVTDGAAPGSCGSCAGELRRDPDVLDTWFSSALWPFATLGWPEDTPELRAFYPTDLLSTARDIIYLWVARMIMCGLEFAGDVPFRDVYIHSVIQAPDGRRMSKSLGTGIDPLDEIDRNGADALRFGLLAMSSSQDVRFSEAKVQQGRDLANKMWNASRLILLNAADAAPEPSAEALEDRWVLSRLERTIATVGDNLDSYDFAHAALELYRFFWSELCDWYLEIVKPRLYDGEPAAAGNLLFVLERTLALAHPIIPFVTEEIWSYLPGSRAQLVVSSFPVPQPERIDPGAEAEVEEAIELTRGLRRWRELADVAAGTVVSARMSSGERPHELVGRLARFEFEADGGEPIATVGPVEILASPELDPHAVAARIEERREKLRSEVDRAARKLANEGFVRKAPADVVAEERSKLDAYRAELEELEA